MRQPGTRTDPRIVRSQTALREALLRLMAEQSFASISIADIVRQAQYNRGTFYANYANKEALLDDIISVLIQDLLQAFRAPYENATALDLHELHAHSVMIFEHIRKNAKLYDILTKSDVLAVLRERMFAALKDIVKNEFVNEDPELDAELHVIYSIHALLGLIFYWIESGYVHSVSYMQEQLVKILTRRPTNIKMAQKTRKPD